MYSETVSTSAESDAVPAHRDRWLLLIHQIPPKPDYLRVKIGRRIERVGAIALKNSVYILPDRPAQYEDFQWIATEIEAAGGEAFISEAMLGQGLTDDTVRKRFSAERNADYDDIMADARILARAAARKSTASVAHERDLARLMRRYEAVRAVDFFDASRRVPLEVLLAQIASRSRRHVATAPNSFSHSGTTWVTRRDVHVDRIASAWLIARFIDASARFRFVASRGYSRREGECRFDMFEAEYTHVGDACTFETLVREFTAEDSALCTIGEIIHDVDCKDGKFGREEVAGVACMIAGIVASCARDEDRLERGRRLFDDLYAAFGGRAGVE